MSKFLKSILFSLIIILGLFNFQTNLVSANGDEVSFIVTAYYSPLPNQKRYTTGSYIGDKRLNGEGHTTASGKGVYKGILAAPKKYPFGTKIYFDGFGVGAVEDRGGAIVKAGVRGHEYDRIDIWMGYGDEGLQRALNWGTRTLKGKVVARESITNLEYSKDIISNLRSIKVNPEEHKKEDVKNLQDTFKKLGLYSGNIDGEYKNIKNSLIDFQIKNKLISSKKDIAAGWFGSKTYLKLLQKYGSKDILVRKINTKIIDTNPNVQTILAYPEINLNGDNPQKNEVIKVQDLLKKLGMYHGKIDGNFANIRRKLLDFQKREGIIKYDNSWGAGYFGEKTKAALVIYFEKQDTVIKKKITIDDISYNNLKSVAKKLKNNTKKDNLIKKLENNLSKIKKVDHREKIGYLILLLKQS